MLVLCIITYCINMYRVYDVIIRLCHATPWCHEATLKKKFVSSGAAR